MCTIIHLSSSIPFKYTSYGLEVANRPGNMDQDS